MDWKSELENCCALLRSNKITERKKSSEQFINLLDSKEIIAILNKGNRISWKNALFSVQECLQLDAVKHVEGLQKRANIIPPDGEKFSKLIKVSTQQAQDNIDIPTLVGYIIGCLRDQKMKVCYSNTFLNVLKEYILTNEKCRGKLGRCGWKELYAFLEKLCEERREDQNVLYSYLLVIKYGPSSGLPASVLRNDFHFVTKLCQMIGSNSSKMIQELTLDIALIFCKQTVKDSKLSCCKFGEDIFPTFMAWYENNGRGARTKEQIMEFVLMQASIHHPKGVTQDHPYSCASDWNTWHKCLKLINSIIHREINFFLNNKSYINKSFFKTTGETISVTNVFSELVTDVSRQLFTYQDGDVTMSLDYFSTTQGPQKRQRIEITLTNYISNISETKSWLWIHIVCQLMKKYPEIFTGDDFFTLLKLLSTLHVESNDYNVVHNIYVCFSVMKDKEEIINTNEPENKTTELWKVVGENTIRAIALNQHRQVAESLLQKLIQARAVDLYTVLQTYTSGVLNISIESIECLKVVLGILHIGKTDCHLKESLMQYILSQNNFKSYEYFLDKKTAELLLNLCLKQFPEFERAVVVRKIFEDDISEMHLKSLMDQLLVLPQQNDASLNINTDSSRRLDFEMFDKLIMTLKKLVTDIPDTLEVSTGLLVFLTNLLSLCFDYDLLNVNDSSSSTFVTIIRQLFENLVVKNLSLYGKQRNLKKQLECINNLYALFSDLKTNKQVMTIVKTNVPIDLLMSFFQLRETSNSESNDCLKMLLNRTLANFCLICGDELVGTQINILEVLANFHFKYTEDDYRMYLSFWQMIKYTKPGIISTTFLKHIFKSWKQLFGFWHKSSEKVTELLQLLSDMYSHIFATADGEFKNTAVNILKHIYDEHADYGPNVKIALINCMDQLNKVDPDYRFACWSDKEVIRYLVEFFCDDYQEVRFRTIEAVVDYFRLNVDCRQLLSFHRQEEIFENLLEQSMEIFRVNENMTEERRIDETISRTASVLHIFGSISVNSSNWTEQCLFSLLKLVSLKNLENVDKVLKLINKFYFENEENEINILEKYLESVIERWLSEGLSIQNFPFKIFNCIDKNEFYAKYLDICFPRLITKDKQHLIDVIKQLEILETDILKRTGTQILGRVLCDDHESLKKSLSGGNEILNYYNQKIGSEEYKNMVVENVEHTITEILKHLTDEVYINETFKVHVIFPKKKLSTEQIQLCFNHLQLFLWNDQELLKYVTEKDLSKLERTLLKLKQNFLDALTKQNKIVALHQYTFFLTLVLNEMNENSRWQHFFITNTIHNLLNWVHNCRHTDDLTISLCNFLLHFLQRIIPDFSGTFNQLLPTVVNSLKYFHGNFNFVKDVCMKTMSFLIEKNCCHLMEAIEKIEVFPNSPEYNKFRTIHFNIKYGTSEVNLQKEIDFFLRNQDESTGCDALVQLKDTLCKQKQTLKRMFDKLDKQKGIVDDCETSSIHQLITRLVKMCNSHDEKVVLNVLSCLGEIGPLNLTTLILQPEQTNLDYSYTPTELLSGNVITLLCTYINDSNLLVVKSASDALYTILKYKEPRRIVESKINVGYGDVEIDYILPYIPLNKKSSSVSTTVDINNFVSNVNSDNLWFSNTCHDKWISSLVSTILKTFCNTGFFESLVPISLIKPEFAEKIFPHLIHLMLHLNNKTIVEVLSQKIDNFFLLHWKYTVSKIDGPETITVNKRSVQTMLHVINFVRLSKCSQKSRARSIGELNINYLNVSKAAEFCSSHFSALLYAELWCQSKIDTLQNEVKVLCEQRSSFLDTIYENECEEIGETLHNILRQAYKAIGDLDALPGCGSSFLLKPRFRVEHYKEHNKWDQVTHYYALQVPHAPQTATKELMASFKKSSLYQIPPLCFDKIVEPEYECLWRLSQWDTNTRTEHFNEKIEPEEFEKFRFLSLKALHHNNMCLFDESKKKLSQCVLQEVKSTSLESTENMYPVLTKLRSIVEMEDFSQASDNNSLMTILSTWKSQDVLLKKSSFAYVEPIFSQRLVLLSDFLMKNNDQNIRGYFTNLSLDFAVFAKEKGYFKEAQSILENLNNAQGLTSEVKTKIQILDAQLAWLTDNKLIAKHILHKLNKSDDVDAKSKSMALSLLGQYLSETYAENRLKISEYFLKSISTMSKVDRSNADILALVDTYDKFACFCDREYQQVKTYMKSDLFQKKVMNMEKAKKAAHEIHSQRKQTHDEIKAAAIHMKQSKIDANEINSAKEESNQFLKMALKYYLLNLCHSETNNIRIFRIISLFLENRNNSAISDIIKEFIPKVPSHKYIMMLPQLIPHISDTNSDSFSREIARILEICAIDHPHHTLPLLLSLSNANKDREFTKEATKTSQNDGRISAATKLISKLKTKPNLAQIIQRWQSLSEALIDLAYYKDKDGNERKTEFNIPRNHAIRRIENYDDIAMPTDHLRINPNCKYTNIIGIASFGQVYHPVGGVNAPKKISCRGTDGKIRSQLVKGQDDLRQDAVMQQVFVIMNNLLSSNHETKNLLIRTYKIVPLSMRSGILEWVDNSMPIGDYLVGDRDSKIIGAHQKYKPHDKSPGFCRNAIKNSAGKDADTRLKTYKVICQNFKPVFHKFFEEYFHQATVWYERRRAYIHSVATTSMCGYILGIGDRHVSNILIDTRTAEVIHIDFGIAFEQGRCLPTPETVPFRLTRDVVDGMGASGIEGIFRRSCEKTMKILRQNSQTIITILEVLLYDPLYAWTVTSAEANRRQTDDDNDFMQLSSSEEDVEVNVTAERALLRLREKLQGTEQGQPRSIEHQVGTLIQQAIDPENLCKLFHGWQAYL